MGKGDLEAEERRRVGRKEEGRTGTQKRYLLYYAHTSTPKDECKHQVPQAYINRRKNKKFSTLQQWANLQLVICNHFLAFKA